MKKNLLDESEILDGKLRKMNQLQENKIRMKK